MLYFSYLYFVANLNFMIFVLLMVRLVVTAPFHNLVQKPRLTDPDVSKLTLSTLFLVVASSLQLSDCKEFKVIPPEQYDRNVSSLKLFFIFVSFHLRLRSIPTGVNRGNTNANTNANARRKTKIPSVPCHHGKVQNKMALPIFNFL